MKAPANKILALVAAAALLGGASMILVAKSAQAKPEFTAEFNKPCGACHQNPAGGGGLNAYGEAFKKAGNKLPDGK